MSEHLKRVWTCCPMGWELFHTSCYYFSSSKDIMSWSDSERNCTGMGSHLVVINTEDEQAFLSNWKLGKGTGMSVESYYIGLTQQEEKGQWRWVDQTPLSYRFWKDMEPNNLNMEKCVVMDVRGNTNSQRIRNWNNLQCHMTTYRICETPATNV
uniref:C-type lectin domain-containing protein n=1 Tax=Pelusios castaneus TaxID=367368 RepID=A0A8C8RYQ8_9SAUR